MKSLRCNQDAQDIKKIPEIIPEEQHMEACKF